MQKSIVFSLWMVWMAGVLLCLCPPVLAGDATLSRNSTLEGIFDRGVLRVGFNAGYMPFEMVSKRSGLRKKTLRRGDERRPASLAHFIGFDIDIAREMAKDLGVKFVPVNTKWPSIIAALQAGRFDIIISGMSVTDERKKRVDFAAPYMVIGQTILLAQKHRATVKSYKDLNRETFVVASKPATTGEAAVKRLMPDCTYRPFDTEEAGANAVLLGQADAFVYDLPFNAVYYELHGRDRLVFLDQPFTEEPLAWAIRKNDPDFMKFLNQFMEKIKSDGRYDRIYARWFKNTDWHRSVR